MLNRWWAAKLGQNKKGGAGPGGAKRPRFVAKVTSLVDCEKWRRDVISEITKNIAIIQNPTLPEDRVRQLNDEINKMIREKGAWERHILSLGGPDYARATSELMKDGGVLGSGGYRYFGAAKNLPGVADLLEERQQKAQPGQSAKGVDGRVMKDVYAACDAAYFGYDDLFNPEADTRAYVAQQAANALRLNNENTDQISVFKQTSNDEDAIAFDESLANSTATGRDAVRERYLALERIAERRLRSEAIEKWREHKRKRQSETAEYNMVDDDDDEDDGVFFGGDSGVLVPSNEDMEAALLARRKEALLQKYVTANV